MKARDDFDALLNQELIKAEIFKATLFIFLLFLGLIVSTGVVLLGGEAISRHSARPELSYSLPLIFLIAIPWAVVFRARARRALREGEPAPWWLSGFAVIVEGISTTEIIAITAVFLPPESVFSGPATLLYGVTIGVTALRLDPKISLLSGFVCAGSYLCLVALLSPGVASHIEHEPFTHIVRAMIILSIASSTALVAHQLRRRINDSLRLQSEKRWVVDVFGRYLTEEVVDVLLRSPEGLELGGSKRELTILMTDLRGFSSLSESLPPERVVGLLNHYLGAMTEVIQARGGTIDEFIGDAILVIFGAPLPQNDHAERAVRCALEMQQAMAGVNAWCVANGLSPVEMGVGVHTGAAVVGNIGSARRQKYGVVGNTVNLAARIESCTVGGQVLVSRETASRVHGELVVRDTLTVEPKGSREPLELLDVVALGDVALIHEDTVLIKIDPIEAQARRLEKKELTGPPIDVQIVALSDREALLEGPLEVTPLEDLALEFGGGQAFVKVLGVAPLRVRFTSRDAETGRASAIRDPGVGKEDTG